MHPSAERFHTAVEEQYGISPEIHEFEEGTKTAADAAAAIGCDVAQIASSIVVSADDVATAAGSTGGETADEEPVVVITSGANRVDLDAVADLVGATGASMADAETVKEATGWSIGGVPPICHETPVRTLLDETLLDYDEVWAAAGTPTAVFPAGPERLRDLADVEVAAVAE